MKKGVKKFMDEIVDIDRANVYSKDEVIAMLTEIQLEIAELPVHVVSNEKSIIRMEIEPSAEDAYEVIQEKINALRADSEE